MGLLLAYGALFYCDVTINCQFVNSNYSGQVNSARINRGYMHVGESERKPMFLCPFCLRKLQFVCRFDVVERYTKLRDFTRTHGLKSQSEWYAKRLEKIQG